jgi:WD40 repeat protein
LVDRFERGLCITKPIMKNLLVISILFFCLSSYAQSNDNFKEFKLGDEKSLRSGIAISPDGKTIAIAGMQSFPLFIYDWENDKIIKKFDVGNWYAGAKVDYSAKGTYLLLQQTFYNDYNPNKDREVDFEIVNSESGKIVQKINKAHSVKIANSETFYVVLSGDKVDFYELPSGNKIKTLIVEKATNSVAISPDEKWLAVSHRPTLEQVKNAPTIRNDKKAKKAIKPALKYREMISLYNVETLTLDKTINELYDIIYRLQFSKDGSELLSYSIPHSKMQLSTAGRQGYIYSIEMPAGTPKRTAYMTLSIYEPDFHENTDKNVFGVVSTDKFPEIILYNYKTGRALTKFNLVTRLGQAIKSGMMTDSRASFAFLPNNKVLIVSGTKTILWDPEL